MYVKPILNYSVLVWASNNNHAIKQLGSIQRHSTHSVMSNYCHTSSVSSTLSSLHWCFGWDTQSNVLLKS